MGGFTARLLAHGFGLWDVLGACEREGSLDSAIRKPAAHGDRTLVLPSTSPAHASLSLQAKLELWRELLHS
ncbi:hypothetical protein RugamoR64_18810 [Duganella rhizosphaerae]